MKSDGEAALEVARAILPDLVIVDMHMPGLSGLEVAEAIRSNTSLCGVRVMTVSGTVRSDEVGICDSGSFDAMLPKPFRLNLFRETVESLLRPASGTF